jgi:phosphate ABC transporter permease protein PstC
VRGEFGFRLAIGAVAISVVVLVAAIGVELARQSWLSIDKFGLSFWTTSIWDPVAGEFGAFPFIWGTLYSSIAALLIAAPIALGIAVFISELSPGWLKGPLIFLTELLAAIPSIVYGLWGIFVLAPKLQPAEQWFSDTFSFLPFVGGDVSIPNYFIAGLILAIMILPIVSAISREVMTTVPTEQKEAALALGATRWEMIRIAVLPYSRAGISGAAMLGLGRAIGETIAVTIVIGNAPDIGKTIFSQGYTLAAVIANEFGEAASNKTHRAALIAAGLVLFVLTLIVNAIARSYVNRASRGERTVPQGMAG